MKTKAIILQKACQLFNERGHSLVSLRDIAQALGRSYGNITYHFPNKEAVVAALYAEMSSALAGISQQFRLATGLLEPILDAPAHTFEISIRYLFLYRDYVEVMRSYPELATLVLASNEKRKEGLLAVLLQLQTEGFLRIDLSTSDLDYLMELSGAMRTFFFLQLQPSNLSDPQLKFQYVDYVNRLLLPYLSPAGRRLYDGHRLESGHES